MIKVVKFRKLRGNKKKYEITFDKNGKKYTRKFGAAGMSDFTIHKDKERRERYISRHKKDLKTKDPMKPGYLSMFILWNKPSLKASLADYKRRLGVYNRTGKFPTKITGSKKLKFGMISSLLDYAPMTSARESLYNAGDRWNMPSLMNLGIDPDIRFYQNRDEIEERDADMMRNALLQRGYDLQDMPQEMTGRRTDNYSRRLRKLWRKPLEYKRRREILNDDWENVEMPMEFGYSVPKNVVNKKLYLSIRNKLKKSIKGRRWGAYDSGRLVKMYKKRGGKYSGKKGKTNLGRWYKEKWVDACAWPKRKPCGRQTKSKIAYCRPSKRVDSKTPKLIQSLSRSTIKSRCARKRKNPKKRINPRKSRFGRISGDFDWNKDWRNPPPAWLGLEEKWKNEPNGEKIRQWIDHFTEDECERQLGDIDEISDDPDYNVRVWNNCWDTTEEIVIKDITDTWYSKKDRITEDPAFGNSSFGSWSRDFFEALMNAHPYRGEDITEACRRTTKEQLELRCGQAQVYKDKCDRILAELFLNIYNSVYSKIPYQKKYNVRQTFQPYWDNLQKEKFPEHIIDYDKLRIILGLLQDEFLPWTQSVAYLASALLYGIEGIS
jgi:hypothetical protein